MLVSGGNYFYEKYFDKMCELLEQGETIEVYIDCVGHTRNNREQNNYKEALQNKYGDKLIVNCNNGAYSISYSFKLKDSEKQG